MKLFEKKTKDEYVVIIGCGRMGANIATALSLEGGNVTIIDDNRDAFLKLPPSFGGLTIAGNGTDFDVLKEANLEQADVVIAVTKDDNTNIMIAQIAQYVYKVKNVIARLYDSEREAVYQEFGIKTICPATLSVKEIDKMLANISAEGGAV